MRFDSTGRGLLVIFFASALAAASLSTPAGAAAAPAAPFDVNGDGVADLVVGAPGEDVGTIKNAGSVTFFQGSASKGVASTAWVATQKTPSVLGAAEDGDLFGAAIASGDFDRDGYADVAIGVPGETIGGVSRAGAVAVIYGSDQGPSTRDQLWWLGSSGVPGEAQSSAAFGAALAAGDFDGDGYGDLAVGAPGADVGAAVDAGSVTILYGGSSGLSAARAAMFTQDTPGIDEVADVEDLDEEEDVHKGRDRFGSALAAGDTTGDAAAELLVGVPNESVEKAGGEYAYRAGGVHLLRGRVGGVTAEGSQYWTQDSDGIADVAETGRHISDPTTGDTFGAALAIGDINGDGRGDAVIGVPREDQSGFGTCDETMCLQGAIHVLPGAAEGLTSVGSQFLYEDSPGVPGAARGGDLFGASVAAGDTNGDGRADVAVGAPGDSTGGAPGEWSSKQWGAVIVLRGSNTGVTTTGAKYWQQNSAGVAGSGERGDFFGASVSLVQLGRGSQLDLAVGVSGENAGRGLVHVLYGSGSGLTTTATRAISQDSPGVPGSAETGDRFATLR